MKGENEQGVHNHISSPPESRREFEGGIEQDDHPESDAAALEQHLARVCAATVGAVQKSHKSWGHNAPEGVALTVQGRRGGTPLPGAQHGEAAG